MPSDEPPEDELLFFFFFGAGLFAGVDWDRACDAGAGARSVSFLPGCLRRYSAITLFGSWPASSFSTALRGFFALAAAPAPPPPTKLALHAWFRTVASELQPASSVVRR